MVDRLLAWRNRSLGPQVLSLNAIAAAARPERTQSQFEVLVRHLLDRLLSNEIFGSDGTLVIAQLVYAVSLPGMLVALFLFPVYHQPGVPRLYWSQAADHLFFVTYSFVIMSLVMIFQWELIFPDLLEAYVLNNLPVQRFRLLLSRVFALAVFLAFVHLGTSGLGCLFLPGVADVPTGFWRHLAAHCVAVSCAVLFAVSLFISLQAVLTCLPWLAAVQRISSAAKIVSVVGLLTLLFLFPVTAHYLSPSLLSDVSAARWFPPFWFLGLYERLLWGPATPPAFTPFWHMALAFTAIMLAVALCLYPLAYTRRLRMLMEGSGQRGSPRSAAGWAAPALHRLVVRTPAARATFYLVLQTLPRLPNLQLYLSMYAGLGFALTLSGLLVFHVDPGRLHPAVSADGIRMAVPVVAFWVVAGLQIAVRSSLAQRGSWIFRVVLGAPSNRELVGAKRFVVTAALVITSITVALLHLIAPPELRTFAATASQATVGVGLCLLLTDLFFLRIRSVPFAEAATEATKDLPLTLVRYFIAFPALVLTVARLEPWLETAPAHLLRAILLIAILHTALAWLRVRLLAQGSAQEQGSEYTELGLRDDGWRRASVEP